MDYSSIRDFELFLKNEISPAAKDINKLDDKNRKHIQKLVYTNLVDRFDTMVDATILNNCRVEEFSSVALKNSTTAVTEAELIKLLMHGDGLHDALTTRLQDGIRNSILRERHSRKFQILLQAIAPDAGADTPAPRVNISTGSIVERFKIQNKHTPHSIVGYADWLYSRRNSIVHGAGTNRYLENDRKQIKRLWKVELRKTFKINVGSISNAVKFYESVCLILKGV